MRTMPPSVASKKCKKAHILVMCHIMSGINSGKSGTMLAPTIALVFALNNQNKGVFING